MNVTVTELQNCTLVRVEGEIDERFDGRPFAGRRGVVVFDLSGCTRITSHGVLRWINGLKELDASYYCFINCRPSTMDQFNLVHGFPQRGELVSFFAPFVCPQCDKSFSRVIDLRNVDIDSLSQPEMDCPDCGVPADFDDLPDRYFRYVLSAPPPRPPHAASAAIGGEGEQQVPPKRPRGRPFELKKEIEESFTAFWLGGFLDQRAHFKRLADGVENLAVIEVSDLEGASEDGALGLSRFLSLLGDRAMLARVPAALVGLLGKMFADPIGLETTVLSFLVPFRCAGCMASFASEVPGDRVVDIVDGRAPGPICPACMHPLEAQWPHELADRAAQLPRAATPPPVQAYLRARPPSGRFISVDRLGASTDPQRLLLGKYQILHQLGAGGMGEVYLARQLGPENFEKLAVLKRIRRDRIDDPKSRDLFLQEARIAGRLSHPNIVKIFDLERIDDEFLISMEYVNGIDLARAIDLSRRTRALWPIEICCKIVAELCSALYAAHTFKDDEGRPTPIVHRDVSPSNILLSTEGVVKLADFGIARVVGADRADRAEPRGKAGYAAPEQLPGSTRATDERTDIYAAGVVLYECLTLRPIVLGASGLNATGTFAARAPSTTGTLRKSALPQLHVARPGLPPLLQDIFERSIQPEPADRYRNARDLGRDVDRIGRMFADVSADDLAGWVKRMVALRLEVEGDGTGSGPLVTIQTGGSGATSTSTSGSFKALPVVETPRRR